MKTALVLSGGGFKGAFQLGALEYLKSNWSKLGTIYPEMHFDIIAGVSVGALNGVLLASDRFDELQKLWGEVQSKGAEVIYTSNIIGGDNHGNITLKSDAFD